MTHQSIHLSAPEFELFRNFVRNTVGAQVHSSKRALIESRLSDRLRVLAIPSYREYFAYLTTSGDQKEMQIAIDKLTTHETYFFREPGHFTFLSDDLLPQFNRLSTFDVWCGAAATGEEPYTLAMVLSEALGIRGWKMLATDVSELSLATAERGHYGMTRAENIPSKLLEKYCLKGIGNHDGSFLMQKKIRQQIYFSPLNLIDIPVDLPCFDLIMLRNVLIYFDLKGKEKIINGVIKHLKPNGTLIVGHAESIAQLDCPIKQLKTSIYVRE